MKMRYFRAVKRGSVLGGSVVFGRHETQELSSYDRVAAQVSAAIRLAERGKTVKEGEMGGSSSSSPINQMLLQL